MAAQPTTNPGPQPMPSFTVMPLSQTDAASQTQPAVTPSGQQQPVQQQFAPQQMQQPQYGQTPQQMTPQQYQQPQFNQQGVPLQQYPQLGQVGAVPQYQFTGVQQQQPGQQPVQPNGYTPEQFFQQVQQQQPQQTDFAAALQQISADNQKNIEKILATVVNKDKQGPDYFNMTPDDFIEAMNTRGPSILKDVQQQAVALATQNIDSNLTGQLQGLQEQVKAMAKQHLTLQATAQLQRMQSNYGQDPSFQQHLQGAAYWLGTPAGQALANQAPDQAMEIAYRLQLANRVHDPAFQQQMATSIQQQQFNQNANRYQAGYGPAYTQNAQPYQQFGGMQQMQPQPGVKSDIDVINDILKMSNQLGFANVSVNPTTTI